MLRILAGLLKFHICLFEDALYNLKYVMDIPYIKMYVNFSSILCIGSSTLSVFIRGPWYLTFYNGIHGTINIVHFPSQICTNRYACIQYNIITLLVICLISAPLQELRKILEVPDFYSRAIHGARRYITYFSCSFMRSCNSHDLGCWVWGHHYDNSFYY
jgi:hypothetical protein